MGSLFIHIGVLFLAIALSGVFSGAETGLYQMSRLRLRLAMERGQTRAHLLTRVLHDRSGLLAALLIGNNLTVQLATITVTYLVVRYLTGTQGAEWIATAITTPLLFVFAELLPKNVFLFRADTLMLMVAPIIYGTYRVTRACGAVQLLQFLAHRWTRLLGITQASNLAETSLRRHEIRALLKDTQDEGFLSGLQTGIMNRVVVAAVTPIRDVMIRMSQVHTVSVDCDRESLLGHLRARSFTRVLVFETASDRILGWINIYEVLGGDQPFQDLRSFVQPLRRLSGRVPVTDAIDVMQREKHKILLVTRPARSGQQRPIGIVTMKDLAEELLGELSAW